MNGILVIDLYRSLRKNYHLLFAMTKRDVVDRYHGQVLGPLWYIGHPLLLMAVYIFIFSIVLKIRPALPQGDDLGYTCYILAGLLAWLPSTETLSRSATLLQANSHVVKNIVFPIEILPMKVVLASVMPMIFTLSAYIVYTFILAGRLPVLLGLLPFLVVLHMMFLLGLSFLISSVGVAFKDMKDVLQVFLTVATYVMPIFYLPEQAPATFQPILYFNPFSHMIWCYQDILYFGSIRHPWSWLIFSLFTIVLLWKSHDLFCRLRGFFGNAL